MMIVRAASGGETFHHLESLHGPWSCGGLFRLLYPNWRESCPTSQNVYPIEANVCCLGFVVMDLWCQARKPIGSYQVLPHFVPVLRTLPTAKSWIFHILWWASSEPSELDELHSLKLTVCTWHESPGPERKHRLPRWARTRRKITSPMRPRNSWALWVEWHLEWWKLDVFVFFDQGVTRGKGVFLVL